MPDPGTLSIIGGLATASKSLADLVVAVKDGSKKSQIEAAKSHIDLAKAQMEAVSGERDELRRKLDEAKNENRDLAERVAFYELSNEYEIREGLLYKKGTGEGPFCQVDRHGMTWQGHLSNMKLWKCPKCRHEARTVDPSVFFGYA